jgi:NAD-dependent deacetylase
MTQFAHKATFPESINMGIRCAADIIRGCKNAVVLTGAGISTPSGIPDFRSPQSGLWNRLDPLEIASLLTFRYNPTDFYDRMRPLALKVYQAEPNAAHKGLAQLEEAGLIQMIVTQNVDALHQRAGSKRVLEVHGTMQTLTCASCYRQLPASDYIQPYIDDGLVPLCPDCNCALKPDVVLMGEQLPAQTWLEALEVCKKCELMIVAGSSLEVLPVAGLPMRAVENGAHLILINHTPTYLDVRADVVFHEGVEEIIPKIVEEVFSE